MEDPGIRIPCNQEGYEDCFIVFKSKGWTFGDRRRFFQANDRELFEIIASKILDCNILEKYPPSVDIIDPRRIEDLSILENWDSVPLELFPWLTMAFRSAMFEVMSLPPASLWQLREAAEGET